MIQDERAQANSACYVEDDLCSNPNIDRTIGDVISARLSRRTAMQAATAILATKCLGSSVSAVEKLSVSTKSEPKASPSSLTFGEIEHGDDGLVHVADGYEAQPLLRWGDAIISGAPVFDVLKQSPASQSQQFGYNCDFTAFLPLPDAKDGSQRGLLCVNHEYTDTNLMFPNILDSSSLENLTREQVAIELAAHGHSVVEIQRHRGRWQVVRSSSFNRRITALDTIMKVTGPAAGHKRLQTSADPTGKEVLGTLNNCAGGVTPWGTMLICEENFNNYFSGDPSTTSEARNHFRYGVSGPSQFSPAWAKHFPRFDVEQEPHEPNRFGWVVEFDPYDPNSQPVKRTALGRCKHEGAGVVVNHDGRVVIYCGDDERFDYVYRFVTDRAYDPHNREANRDLLDDGVLHVAQFDEAGTIRWLPLVYGQGPLTAENDFHCQGDVLIETRRAADLLGATPMDRPEDVEPSPTTGHVFVILTNNSKRKPEQIDAVNPRPDNQHGHILELIPPMTSNGVDHTADEFAWEVFLRAGDPQEASHGARYHESISRNGWLSSPDNAAFDNQGRIWLTTDSDHKLTGFGDGIYACDTTGPGRALPKLFFRGPRGSEVSGICISPDNKTLFVSVQHPGEEEGSDFQKPSTRWPDNRPGMPPRPTVVAITHKAGKPIGS
ncbi:MAG: PhoX family phosphatase [Planctomycetaceae bacterium]|nr:PhoX family phosphatase [Planctomycetales bacterium]MCB9925029.1 PhoX family phosphatase [Planctomycetaceae bacterium]